MNLARAAIRAWPRHPIADRATTNALRRKWIAAVQRLGEKWLLHPANQVQRRDA